jgi:predicted membrane-bound spermidine synthase
MMKDVNGSETDVTVKDVFITASCSLAFATAVMTVAGNLKGNEVVLHVPWYLSPQ